jgi:metal-dependent amidase/aminoacylase/carboxypeptidase family protein
VAERLAARAAALIALRHDLHQHPEVSGAEERTARVVAEWLGGLGLEVRTGGGGHGVVGVLRGSRPGPTVAFRADMDAVATEFPDPVAYRSLTPGVRHICGHDVHVAVALGIAEGLAAVRDGLAGTVLFVFQPAEERASGAKAMLADGVFDATTPDAIYAVHTGPLPAGQLATAPGGLMAGRDLLRVTLTGTGDLAAAADTVRRIVAALGTVPPALAFQPAPEGFVLVQVFPEPELPRRGLREVRAQISTASAAARARTRDAFHAGLNALALPGVAISRDYGARVIAGVTNDSALVERANAAVRRVLGPGAVVLAPGAPPGFSEDFGSFQDLVPGVMYFLGVNDEAAGTVGMPHMPGYVADDRAIVVGAKAMSAVLLDWLAPIGGR